MNLPNRDELLLRTVWAFPKASRIGLALRICCDRLANCRPSDLGFGVSEAATAARYCMTFFVFSVFPAPDSPLKRISDRLCLEGRENVRYQNTLIFALLYQVSKRTICHCVYVGLGVFPTSPFVHLHGFIGVDRKRTIRIYCDQEQAGVGLKRVSLNQLSTAHAKTYIY